MGEQARLALGMNLDLAALDGHAWCSKALLELDREGGSRNHHIDPRRCHLETPCGVVANLEPRAAAHDPQPNLALARAKQADIRTWLQLQVRSVVEGEG
jgi:hypothetical protein